MRILPQIGQLTKLCHLQPGDVFTLFDANLIPTGVHMLTSQAMHGGIGGPVKRAVVNLDTGHLIHVHTSSRVEHHKDATLLIQGTKDE